MGLSSGVVIGSYEIVARIAAGGVGDIWAAVPKGTGDVRKLVAIKTLSPELAKSAMFRRAYLQSAELASNLNHPNVVKVIGSGEDENAAYQVMQWVQGESLGALMRAAAKRKGTPLRVAARIASQICAGIHAGNEAGLLHRDMSPDKILIGADGVVRIADFGTAKYTRRILSEVSSAVARERIGFMAPELVLGKTVDRRADVFAIGAVFYQLLCGESPFSGADEATIAERISSGEPALPLRMKAPRVSEELSEVVASAVAKTPEARFADADALRRAIEEVIAEAGDSENDEMVADYVRIFAGAALEQREQELKDGVRHLAEVRATRNTTLVRAWGIRNKVGEGGAPPKGASVPVPRAHRASSVPAPRPRSAPPEAAAGATAPARARSAPPRGSGGGERVTVRPSGPPARPSRPQPTPPPARPTSPPARLSAPAPVRPTPTPSSVRPSATAPAPARPTPSPPPARPSAIVPRARLSTPAAASPVAAFAAPAAPPPPPTPSRTAPPARTPPMKAPQKLPPPKPSERSSDAAAQVPTATTSPPPAATTSPPLVATPSTPPAHVSKPPPLPLPRQQSAGAPAPEPAAPTLASQRAELRDVMRAAPPPPTAHITTPFEGSVRSGDLMEAIGRRAWAAQRPRTLIAAGGSAAVILVIVMVSVWGFGSRADATADPQRAAAAAADTAAPVNTAEPAHEPPAVDKDQTHAPPPSTESVNDPATAAPAPKRDSPRSATAPASRGSQRSSPRPRTDPQPAAPAAPQPAAEPPQARKEFAPSGL